MEELLSIQHISYVKDHPLEFVSLSGQVSCNLA